MGSHIDLAKSIHLFREKAANHEGMRVKEPSGWLTFGLALGALVATAVTTFVGYRAEQREGFADQREAVRMSAEALGVLSEAVELEARGRQLVVKNDFDLALIPIVDTDECIFRNLDENRIELFQQQKRNDNVCEEALKGIHGVISDAAKNTALSPQQLRAAHAARLLAHTCQVRAASDQATIGQVRAMAEECKKSTSQSFLDYANCHSCGSLSVVGAPKRPQ